MIGTAILLGALLVASAIDEDYADAVAEPNTMFWAVVVVMAVFDILRLFFL